MSSDLESEHKRWGIFAKHQFWWWKSFCFHILEDNVIMLPTFCWLVWSIWKCWAIGTDSMLHHAWIKKIEYICYRPHKMIIITTMAVSGSLASQFKPDQIQVNKTKWTNLSSFHIPSFGLWSTQGIWISTGMWQLLQLETAIQIAATFWVGDWDYIYFLHLSLTVPPMNKSIFPIYQFLCKRELGYYSPRATQI